MQTIKQGLKETIKPVIYLPADKNNPDAPRVVDTAATVKEFSVSMTATNGTFGTLTPQTPNAEGVPASYELDTTTGAAGDAANFGGRCVVGFNDGRADQTLSASDAATLDPADSETAADVFVMDFEVEAPIAA